MTQTNENEILLVGADGYIGSNCNLEGVDKMDLKSGGDFLLAFPKKYDTIIFLAADLRDSKEAYLYNEKLYATLDEWLEEYPSTHVIYASSAAVYGEGGSMPKSENAYLDPINLYGKSKLSGEYHVREYERHTVLRFGNVYGHMNGQDGHGVTEMFQGGVKTIFGDGEQTRDFVKIHTIWMVIELATKWWLTWQGVFNVASGKPHTINEWYRLHGHGEPDHIDAREGDIVHSVLNPSKMRKTAALCK